ncbi:MAG TPA: patatin-like phospholipase family protein [Chitinispirillaceae bacterium]|nr:patatin-like phospholipase family protein [Chitinispirillaceae bacterium]
MKKRKLKRINFLIFALSILLFPGILFSEQDSVSREFALVLSGGGARGIAQIGVLKALHESGLKPDIIVGTSIGAIIGALYCSGLSPDSLHSLARSIDWNEIFSNSVDRKKRFVSQKSEPGNYLLELRFDYNFKPILPSALSYGQSFFDLLAPILASAQFRAKGDFDKLYIPLRIIATDLLTGDRVVFSKGNIVTAVRASCSVPLAFSPVEIDSVLLVDGGLSTNIPAEYARELGFRKVIAVDVTSPMWKKEDIENPVKLVDQIITIGLANQKKNERSKADVVITPDLDNFIKTEFSAIDSFVAAGYKAAQENMELIRSTLQMEIQATSDKSSPSTPEPPIVKGIQVYGNDRTSTRLIKTAAAIKTGDTLSGELIKSSLASVHASDLFENVNIDMDSLHQARIMVEEKKYWRMRMGIRYDEFHLGEGFIQPAYENLLGLGIVTAIHLQYGLRREKYAIDFQGNHLLTPNFANNLQIQFYISKERIFQREIFKNNTGSDSISLSERSLKKTGILTMVGTQIGRWALLCGGFRIERYKIQQSDRSPFTDVLGLKSHEGLPYFMLRLNFDTMDRYPFPFWGMNHSFSIGATSRALGGDDNLIKFSAAMGRYFTIARRNTLFPQILFSYSNSSLPEVERIYLGGAIPEGRYKEMSVYNYVPFMGLPPMALSGDILGLIHLDYRLMLRKGIYAQVIGDWGYTWQRNDFNGVNALEQFARLAPMGIGVGLSCETILGPIRLAYGRLINSFRHQGIESEGQFYFSAGHDF